MKRILAFVVAAVVGFGAVSALAGAGCCAAGKAKADAKPTCSDVMAKMNLTDEQKAKIAELKKECDATKCTEASMAKYMDGMKKILTPDQLEQCAAECKKAGVTGCPMMQKAESTTDKKS